jgi:hypothetical protein
MTRALAQAPPAAGGWPTKVALAGLTGVVGRALRWGQLQVAAGEQRAVSEPLAAAGHRSSGAAERFSAVQGGVELRAWQAPQEHPRPGAREEVVC